MTNLLSRDSDIWDPVGREEAGWTGPGPPTRFAVS